LESFNSVRNCAQHFKQRSWKKELFLAEAKKAACNEAAWDNDKEQFIWVTGLLLALESLL
jgi:hypothetical protein